MINKLRDRLSKREYKGPTIHMELIESNNMVAHPNMADSYTRLEVTLPVSSVLGYEVPTIMLRNIQHRAECLVVAEPDNATVDYATKGPSISISNNHGHVRGFFVSQSVDTTYVFSATYHAYRYMNPMFEDRDCLYSTVEVDMNKYECVTLETTEDRVAAIDIACDPRLVDTVVCGTSSFTVIKLRDRVLIHFAHPVPARTRIVLLCKGNSNMEYSHVHLHDFCLMRVSSLRTVLSEYVEDRIIDPLKITEHGNYVYSAMVKN